MARNKGMWRVMQHNLTEVLRDLVERDREADPDFWSAMDEWLASTGRTVEFGAHVLREA